MTISKAEEERGSCERIPRKSVEVEILLHLRLTHAYCTHPTRLEKKIPHGHLDSHRRRFQLIPPASYCVDLEALCIVAEEKVRSLIPPFIVHSAVPIIYDIFLRRYGISESI